MAPSRASGPFTEARGSCMELAVLLKGRLKGMGREAACEFMAKRRHIPESGKHLYSDLHFLNSGSELPDGDYVAIFEHFTIAVKRRDGNWLIGRELPAVSTDATPSVYHPRGPAATLRALRLATDDPDQEH